MPSGYALELSLWSPRRRGCSARPLLLLWVPDTDCGRPGQPEALSDGLGRPCRTIHHPDTDQAPAPPAETAETADIKARMTDLRDLLKTSEADGHRSPGFGST
ncbi:hypothetical protein [Streptomyces cyaneofuscatus]|uniref:hypothetical protein n=1 Tax=Streptomyces cyaneofuscatus TaxID=66883 RepID=UPI0036EB6C43